MMELIGIQEAVTGTLFGLGVAAGICGLVSCVGDILARRKKEKEFWIFDSYGTRLNLSTVDEVLDWLPYCGGEIFIQYKELVVREENIWELIEAKNLV